MHQTAASSRGSLPRSCRQRASVCAALGLFCGLPVPGSESLCSFNRPSEAPPPTWKTGRKGRVGGLPADCCISYLMKQVKVFPVQKIKLKQNLDQ